MGKSVAGRRFCRCGGVARVVDGHFLTVDGDFSDVSLNSTAVGGDFLAVDADFLAVGGDCSDVGAGSAAVGGGGAGGVGEGADGIGGGSAARCGRLARDGRGTLCFKPRKSSGASRKGAKAQRRGIGKNDPIRPSGERVFCGTLCVSASLRETPLPTANSFTAFSATRAREKAASVKNGCWLKIPAPAARPRGFARLDLSLLGGGICRR